jgi:hypothetical protein
LDPLDPTEIRWVIDGGSHRFEPVSMHEHDPIHELNVLAPTRGEHGFKFFQVGCARLFANDMFPGFCGSNDPFFSKPGRQGDIDRVDVRGCKQGFIRT